MNKPKRVIIKRHYDFKEAFYVVDLGGYCTDFLEQVLETGGAKIDFTFCPITD